MVVIRRNDPWKKEWIEDEDKASRDSKSGQSFRDKKEMGSKK
jgi:hypothetical protein